MCSQSPENTRLTFLKKLNFFRHGYKSTSNFSKGNQKHFPKKKVKNWSGEDAIADHIALEKMQLKGNFFFPFLDSYYCYFYHYFK